MHRSKPTIGGEKVSATRKLGIKRDATERAVKPFQIEVGATSGEGKIDSVNVASLPEARHAAEPAYAAMPRFVTLISHEMRTHLSVMIGNLELLGNTPLNHGQRARLAPVQASSSRLNVINDVLDISRMESGQMNIESVDFPDCSD